MQESLLDSHSGSRRFSDSAGSQRGRWSKTVSMKTSCFWALLLAWVLWIRTQGPTADSWVGAPGFLNQEKCLASMKEKLDLWRQFKDAKFASNAVTFTDTKTTLTYYCLRDTEDPRRKPKRPGGTGEPQEPPAK
jgi:hypothetical protein